MTDITEVNITLKENETEFQVTAVVSIADPTFVHAFTTGLNTLALVSAEVEDVRVEITGLVGGVSAARTAAINAKNAAEQSASNALTYAENALLSASSAATSQNTAANISNQVSNIKGLIDSMHQIVISRHEDVEANRTYVESLYHQTDALKDAVEVLVDITEGYRADASFAANMAVTAANESKLIYNGIAAIQQAVAAAEAARAIIIGSTQAAALSEANARQSELAAKESENAADGSATDAAAFRDTALGYRDTTYDYKEEGRQFASDAEGSAQDALTSENLARQWASETTDTVVAGGKYSASHYADKSSASAAASSSSASTADSHRQAAATSESNALGHSEDAEGFSNASAASATTSNNRAVDSANSATAANTSKLAAAGSATAANTSDINANASKLAAAASLKDFRERYYGAYAVDPTADPYGGAIAYGDLYFNTTYSQLMVWADVAGTDAWKYAGLGPKGDKGDNFGIDASGTMAQRSNHDLAAQGFTFYATDQISYDNAPPYYESFEHDVTMEYTLSQPIGGAKAILVTLNGVNQSPASYTVTEPSLGVFVLAMDTEDGDTVTVREFAPAFVYGAVYFKLSNDNADWSSAIPFNVGTV